MRRMIFFLLLCAAPALAENAGDHWDACNDGEVDACLRGTQLAQRVQLTDLMVRFVDRGCALGIVVSRSDRGMFRLTGTGGPADVAKAKPLVEDGRAKGYSRACANLG